MSQKPHPLAESLGIGMKDRNQVEAARAAPAMVNVTSSLGLKSRLIASEV